MSLSSTSLRDQALDIWKTAVAAVRPEDLLRQALTDPAFSLLKIVQQAPRILVVGGGKASAAMSAGLEVVLADHLDRIKGVVNVPDDCVRPLKAIELQGARPAASNQPTAAGVTGSRRILELLANAGPEDICLCLLSGGGSALLPAPVEGVSLAAKQDVTQLLHACGATINEMNAVRKHLSRIKGGRLAQQFAGRWMYSLIISDVVGDPLDVIASGPTSPDPTTFADALNVLARYRLTGQVPQPVRDYLERGAAGTVPETPKALPDYVGNLVIGNNARALTAAQGRAERLGYQVLNLGSFIEGETRQAATVFAGIVRASRLQGQPLPPPVCLLSGGETTVTLAPDHGRGGRNQEFVLAILAKLGKEGMRQVAILSGGTDGEDGPTDAAGAMADATTLSRASTRGLSPAAFLARNDAYPFFEATGDLIRTGLTGTNVMDVRVILVS